jgi:integrase
MDDRVAIDIETTTAVAREDPTDLTLEQALGHQNLATTSRYYGLVPELMDKRLQENAL